MAEITKTLGERILELTEEEKMFASLFETTVETTFEKKEDTSIKLEYNQTRQGECGRFNPHSSGRRLSSSMWYNSRI